MQRFLRFAVFLVALVVLCDANSHGQVAKLVKSNRTITKTKTVWPNIILINLDDADRDSVEIDFRRNGAYKYLPNIDRLANEGLRFSNMHATTPLCCPSRASLFTGQYAHRHGVMSNAPDARFSRGVTGGYPQFRDYGSFGDTVSPSLQNEIGVWMKQAGYHTMHVGKYLHNGYELNIGQTWAQLIPPGWDEFLVSLGASYYTTTILHNGKPLQVNLADFAKYPSRYRTAVESVEAQIMIRNHVENRADPFFLYIAPVAPHREAHNEIDFFETTPGKGMVENKYKHWWTQLKQVRTPDFNEANNSDKPAPIQELGLLRDVGNDPFTNEQLQTDLDFRRRLLALRSVDDMVRDLLQTLEELNLTQQSVIIFTSDHGYHLGQNRMLGKKTPYDRCTNIPLYVWGPGYFSPNAEPQTHLLANIDIAPTILQLAGAPIPDSVQGKSFFPILQNSYTDSPANWRPDGVLIENWEVAENTTRGINTTFDSLRMNDSVYTEWSNGDREFYDLTKDKYNLDNKISTLSEAEISSLRNRLSLLKKDMPLPSSFIETPESSGDVFLSALTIQGIAEFSQPISQVRLTITDTTFPGQEKFWNGESWTSEYAFVRAAIASKENLMTEWSYEFKPNNSEERKYRVTSRAVSGMAEVQVHPAVKSFVIDADQPFCQFTNPKPDDVVRYFKPINISGWAKDDRGVKSVRITIRDQATKAFWNGTAWQADSISIVPRMNRMQGSATVIWNCDFTPPQNSGSVYCNVKAFNMDGETDRTPRPLRFSWAR